MKKRYDSYPVVAIVGALIGVAAVVLQNLGNPPNMGLCIGCFMRDLAGGIGIHRFAPAQYVRPEVIGVTLGATLAAMCSRQWRPGAGSSSFVHLLLGIFAMLGVLVFLGCPWRAVLRLGGGDLNGLIGLAGLTVGAAVGGVLAKRGGFLRDQRSSSWAAGLGFPVLMVVLLVLVVRGATVKPGFALFFSEKGPGAMKAPLWIALVLGAVTGFLLQRTRFCMVGAFRSAVLERKFVWLTGVASMLAVVVVANLVAGRFRLGLKNAPISHTAYVWSFLGMVLCGLAFTLGGGCPGRQLVRAGEGDGDAAIFCVGMLMGAAICHNWVLTAAPDRVVDGTLVTGGPTTAASLAVVVGVVFCVLVGLKRQPAPDVRGG